jgi:Domain of unknown function (DUF4294)
MNRLRILILVLVFGNFFQTTVFGQKFSLKRKPSTTETGDTINGVLLPEFTVRIGVSAYINKYNSTKRYVLKCIALANFIRDFTNEMDQKVQTLDKKRAQKRYLRTEKDKLFSSFSAICKDMSEKEGYYFNKLVYRQTGQTTYEAIKKYQGSVKAMLWHSVAQMGGAGLKLTYDPYYTDKVIEDVMQQIESGKLKIPRLPRTVEEFNNPVYE